MNASTDLKVVVEATWNDEYIRRSMLALEGK